MPTSPTTPAAIVDRIITVVEAIVPASPLGASFRVYRDESPSFTEYAETKPVGVLRKFQVKDDGADGPPLTSSGVEEEHEVAMTVTIAYPRNGRYGEDQGRDRKRVMREDQAKIHKAIGHLGKANFTPPTGPDATWQMAGSGDDPIVEGAACDFLVMVFRYSYILDVS